MLELERSPGTIEEAAKLADDYLQARKEDQASREAGKRGDKSGRHCLHCGRPGHLPKDCRVPVAGQPQKQEKASNQSAGGWSARPKRDLKDMSVLTATSEVTTPPIVHRM